MRTNNKTKRGHYTHLVAVRVLNEGEGVIGYLVDELDALVLRR